MDKVIPEEFIAKIEKNTGVKMQLSQLAEISGTTKQLINQYKDRELPKKYAEKILLYFSKYNNNLNDDCIEIPIRGNVEASLGYGITVCDESQTATYSMSRKFIDDLGVSKTQSEIIYAKGDSMETTIYGGDSLLIDLSKRDIYDGCIYCIRLDGQVLVKRLQRLSRDTIAIISDNPKYKMREISLKNDADIFNIIGEVRWWGRIAK